LKIHDFEFIAGLSIGCPLALLGSSHYLLSLNYSERGMSNSQTYYDARGQLSFRY